MDKDTVKEYLKDHFFDIFDQAGNGITITDPNKEDNPIIYVNKAFSDIFKYSYEECIGKNCRFLQAKDTKQKNLELIRQAIKDQTKIQTVLRNYTKTGELIYNEIKISPIFDNETGKIQFFLGIQKNISDHSQIATQTKEKFKNKDLDTILQEFDIYETELLAQNNELIEKDKHLELLNHEFSSLFQNAPISYLVVNKNLEIMKFNKLADSFFNFSKRRVNSLFSITQKEYIEQLISWITNKTYDQKPLEVNLTCSDNDTRRFNLRAKTYMIDENLLMLSLSDITEAYEIKTKLEERVKEEVALKIEQEKFILKQAKLASMGEMIDAIAHQWLNPLTLIKLFSQESERLLKEEKKPLNKERIFSYHEKLIVQVDHLVNTLNEFRSFYRPDDNSQCISANALVESTLLLIKDDLIKHKIKTTVEIKKDFEIKVVKNQFKHVILNLFSNSRDAFEEKEIEQKNIEVLIYEDETHHIIKVSDNAGGIPEDVIGRIFEPNFTTKSTGKGSGVGLYLCKQILDKFHIQIDVSNENGGACFTIKYEKKLQKIC